MAIQCKCKLYPTVHYGGRQNLSAHWTYDRSPNRKTSIEIVRESSAGSKRFPGQSLYNVSRAAVRSWARSWTTDLQAKGIRFNVVASGGTATPLMRNFLGAQPGVEDTLNQAVPLGRLGKTDEVGRAVLFLASVESSFIAGHELFVDGGVAAV
ncbi:SDR family NAD(P)-dependent oxidoreductase [Brevundimonas fontaquae]|uniref:SDR family oxidoreductase n=1 Tax=Brevundimonas fontaquae TaxID=2813778 RepID=A0ABX7LS80_9CAUL|nr:SDR family oxidoreductase [Brevundimonas fontaquae]QSF53428.1 SDR family oxidoreductase [Brevundimonas fontaquae]